MGVARLPWCCVVCVTDDYMQLVPVFLLNRFRGQNENLQRSEPRLRCQTPQNSHREKLHAVICKARCRRDNVIAGEIANGAQQKFRLDLTKSGEVLVKDSDQLVLHLVFIVLSQTMIVR